MRSLYCGVVLAAGRSRRMGRSKALVEFGGVTLVEHVSRRLLLQMDDVVINMHRDEAAASGVSLSLVEDVAPFVGRGPLSGLYAALHDIEAKGRLYKGVITVAVDTPFFPDDYVACLCERAALQPQRVLIAASGGKPHPTFALWPRSVGMDLVAHLQQGDYAVLSFARRIGVEFVDFPARKSGERDAFFNINKLEDLQFALSCRLS